jgi:phage shock protein A
MGIFRRLNTVLRSNMGALLDRAEDPEKLIAQTVRDMEGELRQARRELVSTLGTAKRLAKRRDELLEEATTWEGRAVGALRQDDEPLAREALQRRARILRDAEDTGQQAVRQETAAEEMKATLERIERRLGDLQARGSTLAAEVRRAREAPRVDASPGARFGSETFDELERMGERIDQLDAEVEAAQVLDGPRRAAVDGKFRALEREAESDAVEDQLSELKKKLGGGP